jgi:uncharacterized protein
MEGILAPPFDLETATRKVRAAEDLWNSREPAKVALAYSEQSQWRNRTDFLVGRDAIRDYLSIKWRREWDYRLIKELWGFRNNRMAVRFCYESRTIEGRWIRSHGNELWEFDDDGLMRRRLASVNDIEIAEQERLFRWAAGPRPASHPGLSDLGL